MNTNWPFDDAPNTASITTLFILGGSPILRVYHDYEGGWQFHGALDQPTTTSEGFASSAAATAARTSDE